MVASLTYSQAPAPLALSCTSGDDWGIQITLTSDGTTPINLTGYTWAAGLVTGSETAVATITVTETNPTLGVIDLSMTDAVTDALEGVYRWYLTWTDGTASFTPVGGKFTVLRKGQVR